jgi:hypothetical protein
MAISFPIGGGVPRPSSVYIGAGVFIGKTGLSIDLGVGPGPAALPLPPGAQAIAIGIFGGGLPVIRVAGLPLGPTAVGVIIPIGIIGGPAIPPLPPVPFIGVGWGIPGVAITIGGVI